MLALRKTAPGFGLSLDEAPPAHPPGPGEVVVEVEAAGICGSDVHAYEWTDGYGFMVPHLPVVMGHEFAGRVSRPGTGSGFEAGARVCVAPFVPCGACPECRAGESGGGRTPWRRYCELVLSDISDVLADRNRCPCRAWTCARW